MPRATVGMVSMASSLTFAAGPFAEGVKREAPSATTSTVSLTVSTLSRKSTAVCPPSTTAIGPTFSGLKPERVAVTE